MVRVRNNRWVEESRGFERVLGEEIGANEEASLLRQIASRIVLLPNLFEAFQQSFSQSVVPLRKVGSDFLQKRAYLLLGERHDSADNHTNALSASRIERA